MLLLIASTVTLLLIAWVWLDRREPAGSDHTPAAKTAFHDHGLTDVAPKLVTDDPRSKVPSPAGPEQHAAVEQIRSKLAAMEPILPGEVENAEAIELIRRWLEFDPVAAIEYAASHPELHGRMELPAELFISWLDTDGDAAMKWAQALAKGDLRSRLLPTVISTIASQHPQEALRLASELTGEHRKQAIAALFSEWAEVDPTAAIAQASQLANAEEQTFALRHVVAKWADHDLKAAVEWAKRLPPGPAPNSLDIHPGVMEALIEKWATKTPAEAARYLVANPDATRRIHLLSTVAQQWATQNSNEALQWAAAISTEADRNVMVRGVLVNVAQTSLQKAANLALSLPTGATRQQGMEMILGQWTASDPSGLAEWAASYLKQDARIETLRSIVTGWANSNIDSLGRWLNTLPPGAARDACCDALARHLAPTRPDVAAVWAESISDPNLRQQHLDAVRRK